MKTHMIYTENYSQLKDEYNDIIFVQTSFIKVLI
jgi:hypothetical protein